MVKGDSYSVFLATMHVDDFGPSTKGLLSIALSLLGFMALLGGVVSTWLSSGGMG